MKTRRIEVIKPTIEDKTTNQISFDSSGKFRGYVVIDTDLEFAKCLRSEKF